MFDVALTQFVWNSLQVAGSEIAVKVWDKIKTAVGNAAFEKMQQYITNQEEDKFKQQLEIAFEYNQSLVEQLEQLLEQLRQASNNRVVINMSNVTIGNVTNNNSTVKVGVIENNKGA